MATWLSAAAVYAQDATAAPKSPDGSVFTRLFRFYQQDWNPSSAAGG
jgi:hypothetical protein